MKTKYCDFSPKQIELYKKKMHSSIIKLLYFKEENNPTLQEYFETVLWELGGFNSLTGFQVIMIEIISNIEEARRENLKGKQLNFKKYRKLILDSMSLVDKLFMEFENK